MSEGEEIFFGKSEGVKSEETLKEVNDRMEEIDERNQVMGGDGTVVLKNKKGENGGKIVLSTEKVPELKKDN